MRKKEVERIQAFEMWIWIWRKMERISWRDRMSNEKVLGLVKEKRSIMNIITEREKKVDWSHFERKRIAERGDRMIV